MKPTDYFLKLFVTLGKKQNAPFKRQKTSAEPDSDRQPSASASEGNCSNFTVMWKHNYWN